MNRKVSALIIVLIILVVVVGIFAFKAFRYLGENLTSGGGSDQITPSSTQVGQPTVLQLIVDTWGGSVTTIKGRYTDLSLHYKLENENTYQVVQAQPIPLPENYQKAQSNTTQWEAYQFSIPPYPTGTTGEIEYYYEMKFDGVLNHVDGIKEIKIGSSTANSAQATSTSTVSFDLPFKGFDLQLYAPDQTSSVISNGEGYCGGEDGATQYQGTYKIIAQKNGQTISTLPLGQMEFDSGTPHDGLNTVIYNPTGDQLVEINEYGSCNGDYSSFYTINSSDHLVSIPFIGNGTSTTWIYDGYAGSNTSTDGTFCGYDNAVGEDFCDAYQYKNYTFIQTDSWVSQNFASPTPTDIGRAERYLFDFGDSAAIKPYVPSDTQYVDEIDEIQTSTLPYKFQVDFANPDINDYQYIFEVNKTSEGFQAILPPTKI